jgi:hypothetical protein
MSAQYVASPRRACVALSCRSSTSSDQGLVPVSSALGERYRRLANRQDPLGQAAAAAAQIVDRSASTASYVLRQYPLARLAVFGYLLLLHLYLYILLSSMQHAAVVSEAAEAGVAAAHAAALKHV